MEPGIFQGTWHFDPRLAVDPPSVLTSPISTSPLSPPYVPHLLDFSFQFSKSCTIKINHVTSLIFLRLCFPFFNYYFYYLLWLWFKIIRFFQFFLFFKVILRALPKTSRSFRPIYYLYFMIKNLLYSVLYNTQLVKT